MPESKSGALDQLGETPMYGGRGETRTHTPISEPSVFKTAAAMPIRLTLPDKKNPKALLDSQRSGPCCFGADEWI